MGKFIFEQELDADTGAVFSGVLKQQEGIKEIRVNQEAGFFICLYDQKNGHQRLSSNPFTIIFSCPRSGITPAPKNWRAAAQQLVKDFSDFLAANIGSQNIGYGGMNMADAHNPEENARMTGRITATDYVLFVEAVVEGHSNMVFRWRLSWNLVGSSTVIDSEEQSSKRNGVHAKPSSDPSYVRGS
jgi:hypothetical protein